jgi:hypothetical protein
MNPIVKYTLPAAVLGALTSLGANEKACRPRLW